MAGILGFGVLFLSVSLFVGVEAKSKESALAPVPNKLPQASVEPRVWTNDIKTMEDFENWSTFYYLKPRPELTVKALKFADQKGVFEMRGVSVIMIALMTQIFAQNPEELPSWIRELSSLSIKHKVHVWKALWQVNTEESRRLANQLRDEFSVDKRPPLLSQDSRVPIAFEKLELSPAVLDMLWISFCVTGEEKYVERIISALPGLRRGHHDANKLLTAGAAQWSLISNARQHKKVMEICLAERNRHPEWQSELDKVIVEAGSSPSK